MGRIAGERFGLRRTVTCMRTCARRIAAIPVAVLSPSSKDRRERSGLIRGTVSK